MSKKLAEKKEFQNVENSVSKKLAPVTRQIETFALSYSKTDMMLIVGGSLEIGGNL